MCQEDMYSQARANERNVLWTDCTQQSPRKANYRSAGLKCANASLLRYLEQQVEVAYPQPDQSTRHPRVPLLHDLF